MKRIDRVMLSVAKFIGMSTKDINIVIDHHYMSKVYTCGSTVSGHVEINPRTDIPFSLVQISLLEKASIRQEDAYVFTHSTHLFLQLYMPVPESALPTSRLFKVGHSFTIPFQFVIPHNLPEGSCRHRVESSLIRRRHLQLPSTLTGWDKDDLSPETMEVRYCVKAVVSEKATNVAKQPSLKMEAEQFINLLATSPEDLPITINKKDLNFALKNTRHLRKCKRAGSTGYITAKSAQPEAVRLSVDGHGASDSSAQIQFTFDPSLAEMPPPRITVKSVKILAHTWGFPRPKSMLPDIGSDGESLVVSTRVIVDSFLSTPWTEHATSPVQWTSRSNCNTVSSVIRTCAIDISFRLPTSTKNFPPTFHSCIISRTYCLKIDISTQVCHLRLALPIQIVMEPYEPRIKPYPQSTLPD
ncbi:arrestin [Colletotrichum graminicola]|nr:arrestin [Colletotrichum graminicola]